MLIEIVPPVKKMAMRGFMRIPFCGGQYSLPPLQCNARAFAIAQRVK
jgi:hypothetical protein